MTGKIERVSLRIENKGVIEFSSTESSTDGKGRDKEIVKSIIPSSAKIGVYLFSEEEFWRELAENGTVIPLTNNNPGKKQIYLDEKKALLKAMELLCQHSDALISLTIGSNGKETTHLVNFEEANRTLMNLELSKNIDPNILEQAKKIGKDIEAVVLEAEKDKNISVEEYNGIKTLIESKDKNSTTIKNFAKQGLKF